MQERDGVSLDAQREMAKRFCEVRGFELVDAESYVDVMSGTKDDRPGLARLERGLRDGLFDHVLVYKIDRLSRDTAHYHELLKTFERNEVGLASLTQDIDATTSMGRFILSIMIATAALESEQTGDRVRDSIHHRASQGRLVVGKEVPFGYHYHKAHNDSAGLRHPGRLEVNESEAETVRWFYERFVETHSIRQVTTEANAAGRRRRGRPFCHQTVRRMLLSPLYAGMHAALKTQTIGRGANKRVKKLPRERWLLTPHTQPAIVSRELWERAQQIIADNAVPPRLQASRAKHAWSGLIRCSGCGGSAVRQPIRSNGSGRPRLVYYRCTKKMDHGAGSCPEHVSVSERFLDEVVAPAVLERVSEAVARHRSEHKPSAGTKQARKAPDHAKALARIAARRVALLDAYEMTDITREVYRSRMDAIADEERALLADQDAQEAPSIIAKIPEDVRALWEALAGQPAKRGQLLRYLVHQVVAERSEVRVRLRRDDDPAWPQEDLVIPIRRMTAAR
jgi:site-specific DNA recombinase